MRVGMEEKGAETSKWKWWAALAILILALIVAGIGFGLYQLGGADQAPLERLRDITIILAGIAAGLVFLILVLKDQVIPLLTELTETARRLRGTTEFMTEEAVKPIISAAGKAAKVRAMLRTVRGQDRHG